VRLSVAVEQCWREVDGSCRGGARESEEDEDEVE